MAKQQKLIKEIPTFWRPEFIPYFPEKKAQYKLNDRETLMYGFIRFFLKNSSGRFFFTNEQLRYIFGGKRDKTISDVMMSLVDKCPEIEVSYQTKQDGGKVRFISYKGNTEWRKSALPMGGKTPIIQNTNKNTITDIEKIPLKELFEKEVKIPDNQYKYLLTEEKSKFLSYWTERSHNGKKERWEMEKVFDVKRRWGTWVRNVELRMKPKEFKKQVDIAPRGGGFQGVTKTF